MALVACTGCGSEVSTFAIACAKCGVRPDRGTPQAALWGAADGAVRREAEVPRRGLVAGKLVATVVAAAALVGVLLAVAFILGRGPGAQGPASGSTASGGLTDREYLSWWATHESNAKGADWYLYLDGYTLYTSFIEIHTLLPESATREAERVCGFFSAIRATYPEAGKVRVSGESGKYLATC